MNRLARTDAGSTFCTHCGTLSHEGERRVCDSCGLGVILTCSPGLLFRAGAPFLVVKSDLRVSAVSAAVEPLLGDDVVGRPLLDLVSGDPALPRWILRATMGSHRVATVALRRGTRRFDARIGACGDPPAALIVLS
jgi:hypothetical protein